VTLSDDERRYLVSVLRLQPGSTVEVFDGEGWTSEATLVLDDGWALLVSGRSRRTETGPRVHLGVALLKGKKLDIVIRMATELGVASISPFVCERSVARPDPARMEGRVTRWRSLAAEAARQSGQAVVPEIERCRTLDEILPTHPQAVRLVLQPSAGHVTLTEFLRGRSAPERLILVGPEGGFTPDEVERARRAGYEPVRLDLPVLRAETAAVAAATLMRCVGPVETACRLDNQRPVE
jgi:16S rRNA (uracil1498-N3)-methyltransferase